MGAKHLDLTPTWDHDGPAKSCPTLKGWLFQPENHGMSAAPARQQPGTSTGASTSYFFVAVSGMGYLEASGSMEAVELSEKDDWNFV